MRIRLKDFNRGLVLTPPADKIPDNALYRAQGIHRLSRNAVYLRQGSSQLHKSSVTACFIGQAGIYYWNDTWYYGSSDSIYASSVCISSATHDGSRLSFLSAAPTAGITDQLFVAGGATSTLYKIDSGNTVTFWGISPPSANCVTATGGAGGSMTTGSDYGYRLTYYNIITGSRSNPSKESSATKLLVRCTGAHNSTGFADASTAARTVTSTGNLVVSTASADPFGTDGGVLYCDGTTDSFLGCTAGTWSRFSTSPFTIDFWSKPLDVGSTNVGLFGQWQANTDRVYLYYANVTDKLNLLVRSNDTNIVALQTSTIGFSTTDWFHIAVIRGWGGDNDVWAVTVNGSLVGSTTEYEAYPDLTDPVEFARAKLQASSHYVYNGYMSEIRVTNEAVWTEPFTPSTDRYGIGFIATGADDTTVDLTLIPGSTDSQVSHIELWRTQADGSAYFLATRIANSTATAYYSYTDTIADADLGTDELPTDNLKPYYWFDDAVYHNASMFWITRTKAGEKGRVYYSPIGRSEAVQGFINVTDDAEPLQKFVKYGTGLGVFSEAGFFEILGENPYYSRRVPGVPGTVEPHSVVVTPYGVAYEAADGPRLLTGSQAIPIAEGSVDAIFQGETIGVNTAFTTGTVATYARDEYIIANSASSNTLACNLRNYRWRDLGVRLTALHYSEEVDKIAAAHVGSSSVYELEKEGKLDDNSTYTRFKLETKHFNVTSQEKVLVRNAFVDYETTCAIQFDLVYGYGSTLGHLEPAHSAGRKTIEIPFNTWAEDFALRIENDSTGNIKLHSIDFDVYVPDEERE